VRLFDTEVKEKKDRQPSGCIYIDQAELNTMLS
jgi:hypothetical protein